MEPKETWIRDCNGKPIQVVYLANSADRLPTNVRAVTGPLFQLRPDAQSDNQAEPK